MFRRRFYWKWILFSQNCQNLSGRWLCCAATSVKRKKSASLSTHVPHTSETFICCLFHTFECICVLLSLSVVYVLCRITNIAMACVPPQLPQTIYTLTWCRVWSIRVRADCHSERMKTNRHRTRCRLRPHSRARRTKHTHFLYAYWNWNRNLEHFLRRKFSIN